MTHDPPTLNLFLLAGAGFLYIALGAWVLSLTPRRRQTTLLGAFAIAYGLQPAVSYTLVIFDQIAFFDLTNWILRALLRPLAGGLAFALAWATPEPLEDRRLLGTSLAIGLGFSAAMATSHVFWSPFFGGAATWVVFVSIFGGGLLIAAPVLWTLRAHPSRGGSREDVTQLALLTLAIGVLHAFFSGLTLPETARTMATGATAEMLRWITQTLAWLVIAGLWGRNMLQAGEDTVRIHRTVMLGILGLLTAGALWGVVSSGPLGGNISWGVMRTLGVGLLAYGVLRHDLAGLDAKVEWGVSKTTVAGIFVAVFFIVSEGAQALFADFAGNEFLGVLAAGALVFAISPLQRLADRFAAKAVPGSGSPSTSHASGQRAESAYRQTLRKFLADDELSRDEEQALADLAGELGLDPGRAHELHREVEDEIERRDSA